MNATRSPFEPSRPASPGALLAAAVLAFIAGAIYWAAGPRQTNAELEKCRAAYAAARTTADSIRVDSLPVLIMIPKRPTIFHPYGRCAELKTRLSR